MENIYSFFQYGDELRAQRRSYDEQNWNLSAEDRKWSMAASKLAFEEKMRTNVELGNGNKTEPMRRSIGEFSSSKGGKGKLKHKGSEEAKNEAVSKLLNADWRFNDAAEKASLMSSLLNGHGQSQGTNSLDKRFKSLPPAEMLPRNETLGGYIFVCNNDTMQEDLKRQLFGLPQRYRDSVRAIQPGLPLFLYNYTTHQLHGIFEAASFGGSNIDPTAWEDKKCKGESRFPAQVRSRVRRICKPLEEDSFRPVLHHYDGPKFRLQLSVPETLDLLDLFNDGGSL
eukprot:c7525_g1_i1 orf=312-1160(+)